MANIEGRGRSVDEAIQDALGRSGLKRSEVSVNVISEGKSKILGIIGGEDAVVEISPKRMINVQIPDGAMNTVNDIVSNILKLSEMDVSVDTFEDEGAIKVEVAGRDAAIVIGRYGDTLSALQTIVRSAVLRKYQDRFSIVIDVEGYLDRRDRKLRDIAIRMAKEAKYKRRPIALGPMSARERRVVHLALSSMNGISTESQGEGADRHIVITAQGERQKFARSGSYSS